MNIDQLKQYIAAQSLYFLCVIAGIILSSIFILRDRWQRALQTRLRRNGALTTGTITKRHQDLLLFYLTYSFQHEGKTYQRQHSVTEAAFHGTNEGATARIYYAPENPQHNILADIEMVSFSHKMVITCLVPTLLFGTLFIIFALVALFQPVSAGP